MLNGNEKWEEVRVDLSRVGIEGRKEMGEVWEDEEEGSGCCMRGSIGGDGCKMVRVK